MRERGLDYLVDKSLWTYSTQLYDDYDDYDYDDGDGGEKDRGRVLLTGPCIMSHQHNTEKWWRGVHKL